MNHKKLAALKWSKAYKLSGIPYSRPCSIIYDGYLSLYVAGYGTVSKIRIDTASISTLSAGSCALSMATDGRHVWVVDFNLALVTIIDMAGFYVAGSINLPATGCEGIAFDGTHMWIARNSGNVLYKYHALNWTLDATVTVGTNPAGVCFDGQHIWCSNQADGTICKIDPATNNIIGTYTVGGNPLSLCYDGEHVWVTCEVVDQVVKVRASDGSVLGTYALNANDNPRGICFDGELVWVACDGSNRVICMDGNGTVQGSFQAGAGPRGICFDGVSVWSANSSGTYIGRH